ncbi:methyl-accepting chemotaxis protein [Bordetella sp. 02P26C-1]|uniref:methyl-accepting chemotaxis protein n=1 Tax=Bordetella sp. 02P26C-1 TaxID=2683195 RepID=UPI00135333B2|nr:methyl-accepting chemotaxis protein [Bordetella sp. 02P26C-1]MVW78250.1 HAMP domain-containing protein [Bordetella sp. 02P26C-1]
MKHSSSTREAGWWSRKSLSFKMGVVTSAVTVTVMAILGGVMTVNSHRAAAESVQREMAATMTLIEESLQLMYRSAMSRADTLLPAYIDALGGVPILDGSRVETGQAGLVPRLIDPDGNTLNDDITVQNQLNRLTGADTSIIVRDGSSWVRAATLLMDDQGRSAIGSKLNPQDLAVKALEAGERQAGLVQRSGRWYAMTIMPLKDAKGETYGGLTVRVDVDDDVRGLLSFLSSAKVGEYGSIGVLERNTKTRKWTYVGGIRAGTEATPEVTELLDKLERSRSGFMEVDLGNDRGNSYLSWSNIPHWNWMLYSSGPVDEFLAASRRSTLIQGLLMLIGTLAIVGVVGLLLRQTLRPVRGVVNALERLGEGDLTVDIPPAPANSDNEVHKLLSSAVQTRDNLAKAVTTVHHSVDEINVGASEILSGNTDLSSRTEEQAASLAETAASMQELASTVRQNAENARQANDMAHNASSKAEQGGKFVGDVVGTMQDISASSGRIGEIVNVIDSIAFQTNILALNAAVEAARSGEQGRGFAVVAAEVRALAQRSAVAAKEIKALIDASLVKISTGAEQVEVTQKTIREVVQAAHQVAIIMGEISSATEQQSAGIDQVNMAVSQMDQVTQQNAALVEESAAAAASLEEQAKALAEAVSVFKL